MKTNDEIILSQIPIDNLVEQIAIKVYNSLKPIIQNQEAPVKTNTYLTRKHTAEKLGVSAPTVDQFVADGILPKLGTGKRARFRHEDVENLYENLGKYYRRSRKNVSA